MKKFLAVILGLILLLSFLPGCNVGNVEDASKDETPKYVRVEKVETEVLHTFEGIDDEETTEQTGFEFFLNPGVDSQYMTYKSVDVDTFPGLYQELGLSSSSYGGCTSIKYKELGWKFSDDFYLMGFNQDTGIEDIKQCIVRTCRGSDACEYPYDPHVSYCFFTFFTEDTFNLVTIYKESSNACTFADLEDISNYWLCCGGSISVEKKTYEYVLVEE